MGTVVNVILLIGAALFCIGGVIRLVNAIKARKANKKDDGNHDLSDQG